MLDVRISIEWVQKHISAFGGDPDKVTLWGGSAGGQIVSDMLIWKGGEIDPPYRAAIAEYPWWQSYRTDDMIEEGRYGYGDFCYGVHVDGEYIQDLPSRKYAAGNFAKMPLLVDREEHEGIILTNSSMNTTSEMLSDLAGTWPLTDTSFLDSVMTLYPESSFEGSSCFTSEPVMANYSAFKPETNSNTPFYRRASIFGDFIINCPTRQMAYAVSSSFLRSSLSSLRPSKSNPTGPRLAADGIDIDASPPVYKLRFASGSQLHGCTQSYLLNAPAEITGINSNATLSAYMREWFLGFITEMSPNATSPSVPGRPNWPRYLGQSVDNDGNEVVGPLVLSVNRTAMGVMNDMDAGPRCEFLKSMGGVVLN